MAENQSSSQAAITDEKVSPLNYSAHAIDDLLKAAALVSPRTAIRGAGSKGADVKNDAIRPIYHSQRQIDADGTSVPTAQVI